MQSVLEGAAFPSRAGGLGPCLKSNLFVPFYLEVKENGISICRAVCNPPAEYRIGLFLIILD